MPPFSLAERIAALAHRDRQVLVLVAEGLGNEQIAETIGASPQQVAGIRQALRRKLAVPRGVRMGAFIGHQPELGALVRSEAARRGSASGGAPRPAPRPLRTDLDRRRKLVLRRTIRELEVLIDRCQARGDALAAFPDTAGTDGDDGGADSGPEGDRFDEPTILRSIAHELEALRHDVIARVRLAASPLATLPHDGVGAGPV